MAGVRSSLTRIRAAIVKEMLSLLRDPKGRIVLVVPPLLQLLLFSYATTLDVKNADIGILNLSQGRTSAELVQRLDGSPRFRHLVPLHSPGEVQQAMENQKVIAALVLTSDFDAQAARGETARAGLILDGRRSNAAQIVGTYVAQIVGGMGAELSPMASRAGGTVITNWYNPSRDYMWFTIPALVGMIVAVAGLAITGQMVSREREMGTFDQLMVSPLRVHEILIGKMAPPFIIGLFNGTIFLILGQLLFGVPFTGSVLLFYVALAFYLLSLIGVGIFISSLSMTQQQSFLGVFLVMTPIMLLSGYASPIDNMPGWLQLLTYANPMRYFMIAMQGLFLKAMPFSILWPQLWPLIIIAFITLSASAWLFRASME